MVARRQFKSVVYSSSFISREVFDPPISIFTSKRAKLIRINVKNFSKHLKTKQSAITQTANNACRQQQHQALSLNPLPNYLICSHSLSTPPV
ncbi:hypothetical protein CDAR_433161 [Caerostris darwini]|uniref:Uncharacterized protein n=1 Tax=Caerostris darwini TaxID=1538125 RepID=A0AAV4QK43_9ARAC|nr:hypothetical protein CDAR_433161 [Caerostris darwini]